MKRSDFMKSGLILRRAGEELAGARMLYQETLLSGDWIELMTWESWVANFLQSI